MDIYDLNETTEITINDDTEKRVIILEARKKALVRIIFIFWLISTVFLFLRIFLKALGSDPQSLFAAFIYFVSDIFLFPFFGIFPHFRDTSQAGQPVFDASAITAIFCYSILVGLAISVISIVMRILKTGKQVNETIEENKLIDPTRSERVVK
jgi:hypothetical protein